MNAALHLWRVDVWVGRVGDAGHFLGQPTMQIETVQARTRAEAERRGRNAVAGAVAADREGLSVVAEATLMKEGE